MTGGYRGILFDVDGTLVNSNDAHAFAWVDALAIHGFTVSFAEVRRRIGKGSDKLLPEVTGLGAESKEAGAIVEAKKKAFARMLPALIPTRGARALVARLHRDGLRLAVATSAGRDECETLLRIAGVDDLIQTAGSGDEVDRSKPDPDIVHAALERAHLRPDEALLIGDTPYDIDAAHRGGVDAVAFRCGGFWPDSALAGALAIYDDPQDLLDRLESSPLCRARTVRT